VSQGIGVVDLYVHDEEALQFYVEKLGFRVHTDVKNGDYRWLTVQHPDQPSFQLGLFRPQAPVLDEATGAHARSRVNRPIFEDSVVRVCDWENQPRLVRRKSNGVWPVCRRRTFTKWDASEKPARRPTSAVVTRSKSGD
jgi:catechol 2,3-dioxygenase-like lactoylglutathione lyase family enzyme